MFAASTLSGARKNRQRRFLTTEKASSASQSTPASTMGTLAEGRKLNASPGKSPNGDVSAIFNRKKGDQKSAKNVRTTASARPKWSL